MAEKGSGRLISTSKAIDTRYFWMKDHLDNGTVKLQYVPTDLMGADPVTKPVMNGNTFLTWREQSLGLIEM
jgi:hypothetical protein